MALSGSGAPSRLLPTRPPGPASVPGPEAGFGLPRNRPGPSEDSQTFNFIIRNFRARYNRWPASIAELKDFASARDSYQPEFSTSFDTALYSHAVFTTKSDGGLQITYRSGSSSGSMTLGAPK
jgi:hypothetical protein